MNRFGGRQRGRENAIAPRLPASLSANASSGEDDGHTDSRRRLGAKRRVPRKEKRKAAKQEKKKAHVKLFQDIRIKKLRAKRDVEKAVAAAAAAAPPPLPAAAPKVSHAQISSITPCASHIQCSGCRKEEGPSSSTQAFSQTPSTN